MPNSTTRTLEVDSITEVVVDFTTVAVPITEAVSLQEVVTIKIKYPILQIPMAIPNNQIPTFQTLTLTVPLAKSVTNLVIQPLIVTIA